MSSLADVNVNICGKEIIKYDLEIKAFVQVSLREKSTVHYPLCCIFLKVNKDEGILEKRR